MIRKLTILILVMFLTLQGIPLDLSVKVKDRGLRIDTVKTAHATGQEWFDNSWAYAKAINVAGSTSWSGAQTNYQVAVDPQIYNNTGLVGSWHFGSTTSGGIANGTTVGFEDMSGNGNNGTANNANLSGMAWATGKFGGGVSFDGTDDYVSFPEKSVTIKTSSAWVKTTSTDSTGTVSSPADPIISNVGAGNYNYAFGIHNGKVAYYYYDYTNLVYRTLYSDGSVNDDLWHFITVVHDTSDNTVKFYIDGALNNTLSNYVGLGQSNAVYISGIGRGTSTFYSGTLDEVRIYNRALTADEIRQHYNNGSPKVRHDYQDIRFTNSSGTELPYWQETDSKFWVKVDNIPNTAAGTDIYMYYGNPSATYNNLLGGNNTFELFDDFNDGDFTSNPTWTDEGAADWSVVNGAVQVTNNSQTALSTSMTSNNIVAQFDFKQDGNNREIQVVYISSSDNNNYYKAYIHTNNPFNLYKYASPSTTQLTTLTWTVDNAWHTVKVVKSASNQELFLDSTGKGATSDVNNVATPAKFFLISGGSGTAYFDNFRVRKYTSPEPIVFVGQEEASWTVGGTSFNRKKSINVAGSTSWSGAQTNYQVAVDPQIYNNTGLVGSWHFGSTTSGGIANGTTVGFEDMSGNGNNGTANNANLSGMAWATGKFGGGVSFDGSDDYVEIPTISIANDITVSAWVNSPNFGVNSMFVEKDPVNTQWQLFVESSQISWRVTASGGVQCTPPSVNQWHMITAAQSGTTARMYIDGEQCNSGTVNAIGNGNGKINIGRYGSGYYFNGSIDEVKIYNRALTADEIRQHYNNGTPKVRHDYADIKFTNASGSLLDYWQETDSKFWVEVDNIPNTAAGTDIYMYYGNASAASASNSANTFEFFDDFNRANSATLGSNWAEAETAPGSVTLESNTMKVDRTTGGVGSNAWADTVSSFSGSLAAEWKEYISDPTAGADTAKGISFHKDTSNFILFTLNGEHANDGNPQSAVINGKNAGSAILRQSTATNSYPMGVWRKMKVEYTATNQKFYVDGSLALTSTNSMSLNPYVFSFYNMYWESYRSTDAYSDARGLMQIDDFRVRKYVSPEPLAFVEEESDAETGFFSFFE